MKRQKTLAQNLCFSLGWSQSAQNCKPFFRNCNWPLPAGRHMTSHPHRDRPVLAAGRKLSEAAGARKVAPRTVRIANSQV
jgi:hypothetical protein